MTAESPEHTALRRRTLTSLGASAEVCDELLRYNASPFREVQVATPVFPLADEPHVADWRRYAAEAADDVFGYLQARLPQLNVPIRAGISQTEAYGRAVRRGEPLAFDELGGRLALLTPEGLRLTIFEHPAGALPVLTTTDRGDFETLVRALACRSEPAALGPAVNAQIVSGFVNWERVARYRESWSAGREPLEVQLAWADELRRLAAHETWRYQDRFLVTRVHRYSDVGVAELALEMDDDEWRERSTRLRLEHELTHYATQRVFGAMRLNLLDETLADFMGLTLALGSFRACWFLRFLGLEAWPHVRADGRVHTYTEGLSRPALEILHALVVRAAHGLEALAARHFAPQARGRFLLALCPLTLELLAADEAERLFLEAYG
jgi:hypothetical protein